MQAIHLVQAFTLHQSSPMINAAGSDVSFLSPCLEVHRGHAARNITARRPLYQNRDDLITAALTLYNCKSQGSAIYVVILTMCNCTMYKSQRTSLYRERY